MKDSFAGTHAVPDELKLSFATTFTMALKADDWELMQSIMEPGITWTLPGTSTLSGLASGIEAVIKRVQSLKKFGVKFDLHHILYGMHGFTLSLHNTASREELELDEYAAIVFFIHNGLIQSMTTFLSDVEGINKFFTSGIIN